MSLNKVTLIGNVGADPEIKATQDGRELATFSLATSESWKDKSTGEKKNKSEWHRIVVFSQGLTRIIKNYVKKGSKLYIEGQLQTRKWTDTNGVEKYTTEIVLQNFNSNMIMLSSNTNSDTSVSPEQRMRHENSFNEVADSMGKEEFTEEVDEDVPF
jgi:single-strand DNA-binding protein